VAHARYPVKESEKRDGKYYLEELDWEGEGKDRAGGMSQGTWWGEGDYSLIKKKIGPNRPSLRRGGARHEKKGCMKIFFPKVF